MKWYYKLNDGKVAKLLNESKLAEKGLTELDMLMDGRMIADTDDTMYKVFESCGQADKAAIYGVYPSVVILTGEQKQDAKSLKLKQAENAFLTIVMTVPNVAMGDNSDALTAKIEASDLTETQKLSLGLKLLNAIHEVELQGGSWYNLPSAPHAIA